MTAPATPPATPAPDAAKPPGIAAGAVSGMMWLTAQTVAGKVVSLLAQLALAYLLLPGEWGDVAFAFTVFVMASVVSSSGIDEVIVHRQHTRRRILSPAMWYAGATGLLAAVLMVIAAPIAAWAYASPVVQPLTWILASAALISSLGVVPLAELRARQAFRSVAIVMLAELVVAQGSMVLMAALGCGAYSFVVPNVLGAAVRVSMLMHLARPPLRPTPQLRRWRVFVRQSGQMFLVRLLTAATGQGDYVALGLFASKVVVGQYFFAFNLSTQFIRLVAGNLGTVLTSSFARIKDDRQRLEAATRDAGRLTSALVAPTSAAVIVMADPLIRFAFDGKWDASIPLVQILTIGTLVNAAVWPIPSALIAAGRFGDWMRSWLLAAGIFALVVPLGAYLGHAVGTAWGVTLYTILSSCSTAYVFAREPRGLLLPFAWSGPSVAASAIAAIAAWLVRLAVLAMGSGSLPALAELVLLAATYALALLPMLLLLDRSSTRRIVALLRPKLARLLRHKPNLNPAA